MLKKKFLTSCLRFPSTDTTIKSVNDGNTKLYKKRVLVVQPAPSCMKMTGLSPHTGIDMLKLYFDNKKSDAGKGTVAFMQVGRRAAVVGFHDEQGRLLANIDLD